MPMAGYGAYGAYGADAAAWGGYGAGIGTCRDWSWRLRGAATAQKLSPLVIYRYAWVLAAICRGAATVQKAMVPGVAGALI